MKQIITLVCLSIFCISSNLFAQRSHPIGKALVVLTEIDGNPNKENWDVPTIAIYSSGWVIYKGIAENDSNYYSTNLGTIALQKLIASLEISDELKSMDNNFDATSEGGQSFNTLVLNFKERIVKRVYGDIRIDSTVIGEVPNDFMHTFNTLIGYSNEKSSVWMPDKFEVTISDYITEYMGGHEGSKDWPTKWSEKFKDNGYYGESIMLEQSEFESFKTFFKSLTGTLGVMVDGIVYELTYRFPFPNIDYPPYRFD